ncbi:MAG: hypothetical protein IH983_00585 [Planctomycetes bacterium]|nr:hypothetical protein [Planctomycetota bacterium]
MPELLFVDWPVYAYIDPGTGSIIMQAIIGSVAAALVGIRLYWQRIKGFILRSSHKGEKEDGT